MMCQTAYSEHSIRRAECCNDGLSDECFHTHWYLIRCRMAVLEIWFCGKVQRAYWRKENWISAGGRQAESLPELSMAPCTKLGGVWCTGISRRLSCGLKGRALACQNHIAIKCPSEQCVTKVSLGEMTRLLHISIPNPAKIVHLTWQMLPRVNIHEHISSLSDEKFICIKPGLQVCSASKRRR